MIDDCPPLELKRCVVGLCEPLRDLKDEHVPRRTPLDHVGMDRDSGAPPVETGCRGLSAEVSREELEKQARYVPSSRSSDTDAVTRYSLSTAFSDHRSNRSWSWVTARNTGVTVPVTL